jgi:pyridoxine/pyridoxamine 5'-phosphate oxidase
MTVEDAMAIVDANAYLTLATADADGTPWASPVWFATVDYRDFYWVSKPGARHSRNIAARPEVAIAIFDSTVPPNQASAVYMPAVAVELSGAEAERGLEIFSGRSVASGLPAWTMEQIGPEARHRLYRATAREHFVLNERDERIRVEPVP